MNLVTGVFDSVSNAEKAIRALMDAGFSDDDIGVIVRDSEKGAAISDDLGREYTGGATPPDSPVTSRSDVYDMIPDTFVDVVRRSKLPDESIDWYRNQLASDHILVVTSAGDRMDDVGRIVHANGGTLYHETTGMEQQRHMETTQMAPTEGEVRLPVIEEEVTVEKRAHQVGEVRVTTETTSEDVEVPTTVMHQEIRVERRKLEHPVHPDEYHGTAVEGGAIRIPIVEEEVRVVKEPVVREELVISRVPTSERQTIRETVHHTEPHVETTGEVAVEGLTEEERRRKKRPAA